jgi:acetyl esterase/lipase
MSDAIPFPSSFRATSGPMSEGVSAIPVDPARFGPRSEVIWTDLPYAIEPGYRPLFLDLRVPRAAALRESAPAPVIVWVHGGGWYEGTRRHQDPNLERFQVIDRIMDSGYAVALIDYRLARETAFPGPMLDIRAAIRWLRAHAEGLGLALEPVVLWGESAGAHLELMAVMHPGTVSFPKVGEYLEQPEEPQAMIDWYGPTNLEILIAQDPQTSSGDEQSIVDPFQAFVSDSGWSAAELSPVRYARAGLPPVFVAHGRQDHQIPVEQSRLFVQAMQKAGATIEYFETDGDHLFGGGQTLPEVIDRSLGFLDAHLARPYTDPDDQ